MRFSPLQLLSYLLICSALLVSPASAHPRVGGHLALALEAIAKHDFVASQQQLTNGLAKFDGNLLEVQLHMQDGLAADDFPIASVGRFGGRPGAIGTDLVNVWIALDQIENYVAATPQIAYAQMPARPVPMVGPVMSQGASYLRNSAVLCLADAGTGTTIAVLDEGFEHLDASIAAGELPHMLSKVEQTGGAHGTMCAETIADVAPGVALVPVRAGSLAEAQAFAKILTTKGNPQHISIVSHSVGWFGQSFGRHDGALCKIVDQARSAGIAWVNASGNNSGGGFFSGIYADKDGDGKSDFQPDVNQLQFTQYGGQKIWIVLDWDDYSTHKVDLNLRLFHKQQGKDVWDEVASSLIVQNKFQLPVEAIVLQNVQGGAYGIVVESASGGKVSVPMRIVNLGYGAGSLSVHNNNGNVYDPGSCNGVLTVGAVRHGQYKEGPIEGYSSYGPTADGRQKPEVVAPTGTSTSMGDFYGTSCACPHAAGVVALYATALGQRPIDVIDKIIADAVGMGDNRPDQIYGYGRLELAPKSLNWQCDPAIAKGAVTCATSCGTEGIRSCGSQCRWSACTPPKEVCNGRDDDCNGLKDEGFNCPAATSRACDSACKSKGVQVCDGTCSWSQCTPPIETCNGLDDDCDGLVDENLVDCPTTQRPVVKPESPGPACSAATASPANAWMLMGLLCTLWAIRRQRTIR